jgi:hypothetical protein
MGFVYVINSWKGCNMGFLCFFCFNAIYIGIFLEYVTYVYIYIWDVFFEYIGIIDRIHRDIYIYGG